MKDGDWLGLRDWLDLKFKTILSRQAILEVDFAKLKREFNKLKKDQINLKCKHHWVIISKKQLICKHCGEEIIINLEQKK